eukprot:scaffold134138_cov30-Tisochrysis_lutea.AAC.4
MKRVFTRSTLGTAKEDICVAQGVIELVVANVSIGEEAYIQLVAHARFHLGVERGVELLKASQHDCEPSLGMQLQGVRGAAAGSRARRWTKAEGCTCAAHKPERQQPAQPMANARLRERERGRPAHPLLSRPHRLLSVITAPARGAGERRMGRAVPYVLK